MANEFINNPTVAQSPHDIIIIRSSTILVRVGVKSPVGKTKTKTQTQIEHMHYVLRYRMVLQNISHSTKCLHTLTAHNWQN